MSEREEISAEILLLHERFQADTKQVNDSITKLGSQFEAAFAKINAGSDEHLKAVANHLRQLDSKFDESMKLLQQKADSVKFDKLADTLEGLGKRAQEVFSGTVGTGAGFETEIGRIAAISDISGAKLDELSERLRTLAKEYGLSVGPAETAAVALQAIGSGFEDSASSTTVAANALKLIADGQTGATAATKLLTDTLNAYHVSADSAAKFTDIFFQVQNRGVVTIAEMSQSLGMVTSVASSAGVSLEELGAAIVVTTKQGVPFSSSVEGMRGLITALQNPTDEAQKALNKYGLTVNYATLRQKGLGATLKEIKTAIGADAGALKDITGSQQAFAIATALTSDNLKAFGVEVKAVGNATGAADRSNAILRQGFENSSKAFKAAIERLQVGATKELLPALTKVVNAAAELIDALDRVPQWAKTFGLAVVGIAAAVGLAAGAIIGFKGLLVGLGIESIGVGGALTKGIGGAMRFLAMDASKLLPSVKGVKELGAAAKAAGSGGLRALNAGFETLFPTVARLTGLTGGVVAVGVAAGVAGAICAKWLVDMAMKAKDAEVALKRANLGFSEMGSDKPVTEIFSEDALSSSLASLTERGVTSRDIRNRVAIERNKLSPVGGGTEAENKAEEEALAKERPARLKMIEELKKRAQELEEYQAKAAANQKEAADEAATAAAKQAETAKDSYRFELQRIEQSKAGYDEKIRQLESLRSRFKLDASEELGLRDKIHQYREKSEKYLSDQAKKSSSERFKQSVQEIENSKKSLTQKISDLKKLLPQYEKNGDFRRQIEDKVLAYEKKLDAEREKMEQRKLDRQKAAADERIRVADNEQQQLEKRQSKGVDTTVEQAAQVDVKAKAEKEKIDADLEKALKRENDPEAKKDLRDQAEREKKRVDDEARIEKSDISERGNNDRLQRESEHAGKDAELGQQRLEHLKEYTVAGKGSAAFFEQAALRQLELVEAQIEAQKRLALAQTEDPKRIAQIEREAEAQKLAAKRATRDEIEATSRAMEEQRKAAQAGKSQEFSGRIQSLQEFVDGENSRFNDGSVEENYRKMLRKKPYVPGLEEGIWNELNRDPLRKKQPGEADKASQQGAAPQELRIAGEFRLVGEDGREVGHLDKISFNGENSRAASFARGAYGGA